eukprot:4923730-Pleurochrysis_carterae.AAC.8
MMRIRHDGRKANKLADENPPSSIVVRRMIEWATIAPDCLREHLLQKVGHSSDANCSSCCGRAGIREVFSSKPTRSAIWASAGVRQGRDQTAGRLRIFEVLYVKLLVGHQAVLSTNAHIGVQWLLLGALAFSMFAFTATNLSSINTTLSLIREQDEGTARPSRTHTGHSAPKLQICLAPADLHGEAADFNAAVLSRPSPPRLRPPAESVAAKSLRS